MHISFPFACTWSLLLSLVFGTTPAQGCSITLISAVGTDYQYFCTQTFNEPIEPIVYVIDDTGYSITDLPPGITHELVNDTLTLTGTLTTLGSWDYTITSDQGCPASGNFMVSESLDPALTCSVEGENITLFWDPLITDFPADGVIFINWSYVGVMDNAVFILPTPSTFTVHDLPPGTEVTFIWQVSVGYPRCSDQAYSTTCSTTPLGLEAHEHAAFTLAPNPVGQFIQLTGESPIDQVKFFDLLGHEVGPRMVQPRSGQIDVSSLEPGAYVMQILSNGRKTFLRFIKD